MHAPNAITASSMNWAQAFPPLALGSTVPELNTAPLESLHLGTFEKTAFSMVIPPVTALLEKHNFKSVVLFEIEVRRPPPSSSGVLRQLPSRPMYVSSSQPSISYA